MIRGAGFDGQDGSGNEREVEHPASRIKVLIDERYVVAENRTAGKPIGRPAN